MKGKVKFFNSTKGFGFIAGEDGKEYFVHQTAVAPGTMLRDNDSVTFDVVMGDKGPKAGKVAIDKGGAAPAKAPAADDVEDDEESSDDDEDEEEN